MNRIRYFWLLLRVTIRLRGGKVIPKEMTENQRERSKRDIECLSEFYARRHNGPKHRRRSFSGRTLESIPERTGVYRFFRRGEQEVKYIGTSINLRQRLTKHFKNSDNPNIAELVLSGEAEVSWRITPCADWWEDWELFEYQRKHDGQLPAFNRIRAGASTEQRRNYAMVGCMAIFAVLGLLGCLIGTTVGLFLWGIPAAFVGAIVGTIAVPICVTIVAVLFAPQ